tara:strand:- start:667 stop:2163 length:1497 start_codon:yes stop_codon:yes gene_type:complete
MSELFKKIISHCKEYGFIFNSSEIYDGLSAVYDYGPLGVELKNNIKSYWWDAMVKRNKNIVGIDSSIFMHPDTWKASGHIDAFNDPLIDNKDSKKRYRADVLIENHIEKIKNKINKDIKKAKTKFGENFNEKEFITTNQRVLDRQKKIDEITLEMNECLESENLKGIKELIEKIELKCPLSGTCNWTEVRQFNLMFKTKIGSNQETSSDIYLRPETAQGIFVNFLNVQKTTRQKIPFGIAQIGKAFRNEIIARQFIFRMREFEQMEMQFFIRPGEEDKWYEYWKEKRMDWHVSLGFEKNNFSFKKHTKLAHYAKSACDIEFKFPFGFKELEGIHSRSDFDLIQHQKLSGKKIKYFDSEINESFTPFVIETSIGLDRMFLACLCSSFMIEEKNNRLLLKLPYKLAPIKIAVFPLTKEDSLINIANNIYEKLNKKYNCFYEEKDSIGKRYRRQDAIGTPLCITVDKGSEQDQKITIRNRDSMSQERVALSKIEEYISSYF